MILKDIEPNIDGYFAELVDADNDRTIPVIIQKAGGRCEWIAIDAVNRKNIWEIIFVGTNKPNIENWEAGDEILLGNSIK